MMRSISIRVWLNNKQAIVYYFCNIYNKKRTYLYGVRNINNTGKIEYYFPMFLYKEFISIFNIIPVNKSISISEFIKLVEECTEGMKIIYDENTVTNTIYKYIYNSFLSSIINTKVNISSFILENKKDSTILIKENGCIISTLNEEEI